MSIRAPATHTGKEGLEPGDLRRFHDVVLKAGLHATRSVRLLPSASECDQGAPSPLVLRTDCLGDFVPIQSRSVGPM